MTTRNRSDALSSHPVLTAPTPALLEPASERRDLPRGTSFPSELDSVISPSNPLPSPKRPKLRPTDRDLNIVDLVFRLRAARDDQIQLAFFSPTNDSACQRRLTKLVAARWLGRLPRQSVTEQYVYVLDRSSVQGNRIMRERHGEDEFRRRTYRLGSVQHLLGVNDVGLRIVLGARSLGWTLQRWQRPEQLATFMAERAHLVPDAYFQIRRTVGGEARTAGLFLELQRSVRSSAALSSKLERYAGLLSSGLFKERFGSIPMRVLVVFTSEPGFTGEERARKATKQAERQGVTFVRLGSLDAIRSRQSEGLLTGDIWSQPGQAARVPLFAPG